MTDRIHRINELLRQELSQLLEDDAEKFGMVTVLAVSTTRDLSLATILIAPVGQNVPPHLVERLAKRAGAYRHRLGQRLKLKKIPELHFQTDSGSDQYLRVEALLDQVTREHTS